MEDFGIWPDGLLDAYIAMIPKTDGDATPLVRGLLVFSLLCIEFGLLLERVSLKVGFSLGFLIPFSVLGVVVGRLILKKFFLVPLISSSSLCR